MTINTRKRRALFVAVSCVLFLVSFVAIAEVLVRIRHAAKYGRLQNVDNTVTYDEVLARQLGVMDLAAIVLCKEHDMPLVVFDFATEGALVDIANGATVGTRVVRG